MEHHIHTVIAPVGLGGKTAPYIADPAPTLLVELASVETERETARIAALLAEAKRSAAALVKEAQATVADTVRAAEQEAESIRSQADERRVELDAVAADLATQSQALDQRRTQLDNFEGELNDRTAAVDAEAAEAGSILAGARTDAEAILAEAHSRAEAVLEDAKEQARLAADSAAAEAKAAQEADGAIASRVAEIEGIHRIEVQVLHQRETELLAKIGYLESQLRSATHAEKDAEHAPDAVTTSTVAVDLDSLTPSATESRLSGRHNGDGRTVEYAASGPLATHAPLTEQLSTSAFRASPELDRRGRRRR